VDGVAGGMGCDWMEIGGAMEHVALPDGHVALPDGHVALPDGQGRCRMGGVAGWSRDQEKMLPEKPGDRPPDGCA
jgi:hypothetical protein